MCFTGAAGKVRGRCWPIAVACTPCLQSGTAGARSRAGGAASRAPPAPLPCPAPPRTLMLHPAQACPPVAGLLVFADWYHLESIQNLRFYDDNTRSWWDAATGGVGRQWGFLDGFLMGWGVMAAAHTRPAGRNVALWMRGCMDAALAAAQGAGQCGSNSSSGSTQYFSADSDLEAENEARRILNNNTAFRGKNCQVTEINSR